MIISNEANALAYQTGIKVLAPLVQRIIDLEQAVKELRAKLENAAKQN
jgi:galactose-1-phosphate uridylyltransferase